MALVYVHHQLCSAVTLLNPLPFCPCGENTTDFVAFLNFLLLFLSQSYPKVFRIYSSGCAQGTILGVED